MNTARAYMYRLLDAHDGGSGLERVFDGVLLSLVLINGAAVVLESVQRLQIEYKAVFTGIEVVSVYAFTLEYLLRAWSCVEDRRYKRTIFGRVRFLLTPMAVIDLLAILPFFLTVGALDLRILRLLRLFRLLKVARYVRALHVIGHVVRSKRPELLVTTCIIGLMLVLVSSLMYFVEGEAQPDKFGSIPETMWWGVATLTTVGYGDVYPISVAGKVLSSVIAVLGLGLFALPTGILAAGFSEHLAQQRAAAKVHAYCPHCGHKL